MINPFSLFGQSGDEYMYTLSDPQVLQSSSAEAGGVSAGLIIFYVLLYLVFSFFTFMIFKKANQQPTWGAFVPIYNTYLMLKMVGRPGWWLVLFFIPFVNIVIFIIATHDMSKSFGKGVGYTVLLLLLPIVGYPLLAFGDAKYVGPAAADGGAKPSGSGPAQPTPPAATPAV